LTDFWKILKYQNSWKSIKWQLSCYMMKLTVALWNSVKGLQNV